MKKSLMSIIVLAAFSLILALGGCFGAGSSSGAPAVSADQPTASETTQAASQSTVNDSWLVKLKWQADWVWKSYSALKTKVDATTPDMVKLCANAWEMVSNIKSGNLTEAFVYFTKAKENISSISKDLKE